MPNVAAAVSSKSDLSTIATRTAPLCTFFRAKSDRHVSNLRRDRYTTTVHTAARGFAGQNSGETLTTFCTRQQPLRRKRFVNNSTAEISKLFLATLRVQLALSAARRFSSLGECIFLRQKGRRGEKGERLRGKKFATAKETELPGWVIPRSRLPPVAHARNYLL